MRWNKKPNFVRSIRQRRASAAGFTLIELLIVIVILAISAAIVVPMASSATSMQLRSAVNMVAADLEYAKSMAIGTGRPHSVVFDATNETYQIVRTLDDGTTTVIPHPVKKGFDYIVNFSNDGRLDRVGIVSADFDGAGTVKFDYLGSPLALNSQGVVTLQAGGVQKEVRVEPVTGFISISD